VPLVDAELNRQFPGRELQKARTPEGRRGAACGNVCHPQDRLVLRQLSSRQDVGVP